MMGLQASKHLVAKSQFPPEPKGLMGKAELCRLRCRILFMYAPGGSADKTASPERVCLHSRSDTLR